MLPGTCAFQRRAIPPGEVGGCLVCALEEGEEKLIWSNGSANGFVRQKELPQIFVVSGGLGLNRILLEAIRLRIGIRIEDRVEAVAARPEAAAAHLVRICFA